MATKSNPSPRITRPSHYRTNPTEIQHPSHYCTPKLIGKLDTQETCAAGNFVDISLYPGGNRTQDLAAIEPSGNRKPLSNRPILKTHLIASQSMTIAHAHFLASLPSHGVQTVQGFRILHLAQIVVVQRHLRLRVHILQIPSEALTLQSFSQFFPLRYITYVHTGCS